VKKVPSQAVLVAPFLIVLISGCQHMEKALPASVGVVAGATCNALFKGKNQSTATVMCAAAGVWVGKKIQTYLNEQEQAKLSEATYATFDTGKKQTIRTPEGNLITTERVGNSKKNEGKSGPKGAKSSDLAMASPSCGEVKQTIITKDNQRVEEIVKGCKKGDTWEIV